MGAMDLPTAQIDGRGHNFIGREHLHRQTNAHDIRQRIHRAHLVEVNLLHRRAVRVRLCLSDQPIDRQRILFDALRYWQMADLMRNVRHAAVGMLMAVSMLMFVFMGMFVLVGMFMAVPMLMFVLMGMFMAVPMLMFVLMGMNMVFLPMRGLLCRMMHFVGMFVRIQAQFLLSPNRNCHVRTMDTALDALLPGYPYAGKAQRIQLLQKSITVRQQLI